MTDIAERVREACAKICEDAVNEAAGKPATDETFAVIVALSAAAVRIRAMTLPDDPRDAEIAALRPSLHQGEGDEQ